MSGGRRYPEGFTLGEDEVVAFVAVDEKARIITSPLSGADDDEAIVSDGQVIDTDDGGTITLSVSGNTITAAVYAAPE